LEDDDTDGSVENTDTINLQDGVTDYSASGLSGSGNLSLNVTLSNTDLTVGSTVEVPVNVTGETQGSGGQGWITTAVSASLSTGTQFIDYATQDIFIQTDNTKSIEFKGTAQTTQQITNQINNILDGETLINQITLVQVNDSGTQTTEFNQLQPVNQQTNTSITQQFKEIKQQNLQTTTTQNTELDYTDIISQGLQTILSNQSLADYRENLQQEITQNTAFNPEAVYTQTRIQDIGLTESIINTLTSGFVVQENIILTSSNITRQDAKAVLQQNSSVRDQADTQVVYSQEQQQGAGVNSLPQATINLLTSSITDPTISNTQQVSTGFNEGPSQKATVQELASIGVQYLSNPSSTANTFTTAQSIIDFVEKAATTITADTEPGSNVRPRLTGAELIVENLQNSQDLKLNLTVEDIEGRLELIDINGKRSQVSGTNDYAVIDIDDSLQAQKTIDVFEQSGKFSSYIISYKILETTPSTTSASNLETQTIQFQDSIENTGPNPFNYTVTHFKPENSTVITEGTNTGLLQVNETDQLITETEGDFLNVEKQWKTANDTYNTVDNQTIYQSLNVTSKVEGVEYTGVSTGNTTVPQSFQPCNSCSSDTISFTDSYYNARQWRDTGDGINDQFIQDITDVNIGDRPEWWEQYNYNNKTGEVIFKDIWANITLDENQTEYQQPFVRVFAENTWNNTINLPEDQLCDTRDTRIQKFDIAQEVWKACAKDLNNNDQPEYIRIQIPEFSTERIRYGLGQAPKETFQYSRGDSCPDDREGDTFQNGSLTCFRNEVIKSKAIDLPIRNVTVPVGQAIAAIAFFGVIVAALYLIFRDERNREIVENILNLDSDDEGDFSFDS
jgi:hypothetical protein